MQKTSKADGRLRIISWKDSKYLICTPESFPSEGLRTLSVSFLRISLQNRSLERKINHAVLLSAS